MLIKLDENLPSRLVGVLTALGHQIDTVPMRGLQVDQITRYGMQPRQQDDFSSPKTLTFPTCVAISLAPIPESCSSVSVSPAAMPFL